MNGKKEYFIKFILKPLTAWAVLVFTDQATKYAVRTFLYPGETVPLTPFFQLTYLTNTGIAFSMFQGANAVFAVFSAAVVAVFAGWFVVNAPRIDALAKAALVLIISGATGNLIDRLTSGRVTDFLDFFAGGYHWPSFNAADSCISIGGVLLLIWSVKPDRALGGKNAADNN